MGLGMGLEMQQVTSPSPSPLIARSSCVSGNAVCLSTLEEADTAPASARVQQQYTRQHAQQQQGQGMVTVEESVESFLFSAADPVLVNDQHPHAHEMWGGGVVQRQTSSGAAVGSSNDHGGIIRL